MSGPNGTPSPTSSPRTQQTQQAARAESQQTVQGAPTVEVVSSSQRPQMLPSAPESLLGTALAEQQVGAASAVALSSEGYEKFMSILQELSLPPETRRLSEATVGLRSHPLPDSPELSVVRFLNTLIANEKGLTPQEIQEAVNLIKSSLNTTPEWFDEEGIDAWAEAVDKLGILSEQQGIEVEQALAAIAAMVSKNEDPLTMTAVSQLLQGFSKHSRNKHCAQAMEDIAKYIQKTPKEALRNVSREEHQQALTVLTQSKNKVLKKAGKRLAGVTPNPPVQPSSPARVERTEADLIAEIMAMAGVQPKQERANFPAADPVQSTHQSPTAQPATILRYRTVHNQLTDQQLHQACSTLQAFKTGQEFDSLTGMLKTAKGKNAYLKFLAPPSVSSDQAETNSQAMSIFFDQLGADNTGLSIGHKQKGIRLANHYLHNMQDFFDANSVDSWASAANNLAALKEKHAEIDIEPALDAIAAMVIRANKSPNMTEANHLLRGLSQHANNPRCQQALEKLAAYLQNTPKETLNTLSHEEHQQALAVLSKFNIKGFKGAKKALTSSVSTQAAAVAASVQPQPRVRPEPSVQPQPIQGAAGPSVPFPSSEPVPTAYQHPLDETRNRLTEAHQQLTTAEIGRAKTQLPNVNTREALLSMTPEHQGDLCLKFIDHTSPARMDYTNGESLASFLDKLGSDGINISISEKQALIDLVADYLQALPEYFDKNDSDTWGRVAAELGTIKQQHPEIKTESAMDAVAAMVIKTERAPTVASAGQLLKHFSIHPENQRCIQASTKIAHYLTDPSQQLTGSLSRQQSQDLTQALPAWKDRFDDQLYQKLLKTLTDYQSHVASVGSRSASPVSETSGYQPYVAPEGMLSNRQLNAAHQDLAHKDMFQAKIDAESPRDKNDLLSVIGEYEGGHYLKCIATAKKVLEDKSNNNVATISSFLLQVAKYGLELDAVDRKKAVELIIHYLQEKPELFAFGEAKTWVSIAESLEALKDHYPEIQTVEHAQEVIADLVTQAKPKPTKEQLEKLSVVFNRYTKNPVIKEAANKLLPYARFAAEQPAPSSYKELSVEALANLNHLPRAHRYRPGASMQEIADAKNRLRQPIESINGLIPLIGHTESGSFLKFITPRNSFFSEYKSSDSNMESLAAFLDQLAVLGDKKEINPDEVTLCIRDLTGHYLQLFPEWFRSPKKEMASWALAADKLGTLKEQAAKGVHGTLGRQYELETEAALDAIATMVSRTEEKPTMEQVSQLLHGLSQHPDNLRCQQAAHKIAEYLQRTRPTTLNSLTPKQHRQVSRSLTKFASKFDSKDNSFQQTIDKLATMTPGAKVAIDAKTERLKKPGQKAPSQQPSATSRRKPIATRPAARVEQPAVAPSSPRGPFAAVTPQESIRAVSDELAAHLFDIHNSLRASVIADAKSALPVVSTSEGLESLIKTQDDVSSLTFVNLTESAIGSNTESMVTFLGKLVPDEIKLSINQRDKLVSLAADYLHTLPDFFKPSDMGAWAQAASRLGAIKRQQSEIHIEPVLDAIAAMVSRTEEQPTMAQVSQLLDGLCQHPGNSRCQQAAEKIARYITGSSPDFLASLSPDESRQIVESLCKWQGSQFEQAVNKMLPPDAIVQPQTVSPAQTLPSEPQATISVDIAVPHPPFESMQSVASTYQVPDTVPAIDWLKTIHRGFPDIVVNKTKKTLADTGGGPEFTSMLAHANEEGKDSFFLSFLSQHIEKSGVTDSNTRSLAQFLSKSIVSDIALTTAEKQRIAEFEAVTLTQTQQEAIAKWNDKKPMVADVVTFYLQRKPEFFHKAAGEDFENLAQVAEALISFTETTGVQTEHAQEAIARMVVEADSAPSMAAAGQLLLAFSKHPGNALCAQAANKIAQYINDSSSAFLATLQQDEYHQLNNALIAWQQEQPQEALFAHVLHKLLENPPSAQPEPSGSAQALDDDQGGDWTTVTRRRRQRPTTAGDRRPLQAYAKYRSGQRQSFIESHHRSFIRVKADIGRQEISDAIQQLPGSGQVGRFDESRPVTPSIYRPATNMPSANQLAIHHRQIQPEKLQDARGRLSVNIPTEPDLRALLSTGNYLDFISPNSDQKNNTKCLVTFLNGIRHKPMSKELKKQAIDLATHYLQTKPEYFDPMAMESWAYVANNLKSLKDKQFNTQAAMEGVAKMVLASSAQPEWDSINLLTNGLSKYASVGQCREAGEKIARLIASTDLQGIYDVNLPSLANSLAKWPASDDCGTAIENIAHTLNIRPGALQQFEIPDDTLDIFQLLNGFSKWPSKAACQDAVDQIAQWLIDHPHSLQHFSSQQLQSIVNSLSKFVSDVTKEALLGIADFIGKYVDDEQLQQHYEFLDFILLINGLSKWFDDDRAKQTVVKIAGHIRNHPQCWEGAADEHIAILANSLVKFSDPDSEAVVKIAAEKVIGREQFAWTSLQATAMFFHAFASFPNDDNCQKAARLVAEDMVTNRDVKDMDDQCLAMMLQGIRQFDNDAYKEVADALLNETLQKDPSGLATRTLIGVADIAILHALQKDDAQALTDPGAFVNYREGPAFAGVIERLTRLINEGDSAQFNQNDVLATAKNFSRNLADPVGQQILISLATRIANSGDLSTYNIDGIATLANSFARLREAPECLDAITTLAQEIVARDSEDKNILAQASDKTLGLLSNACAVPVAQPNCKKVIEAIADVVASSEDQPFGSLQNLSLMAVGFTRYRDSDICRLALQKVAASTDHCVNDLNQQPELHHEYTCQQLRVLLNAYGSLSDELGPHPAFEEFAVNIADYLSAYRDELVATTPQGLSIHLVALIKNRLTEHRDDMAPEFAEAIAALPGNETKLKQEMGLQCAGHLCAGVRHLYAVENTRDSLKKSMVALWPTIAGKVEAYLASREGKVPAELAEAAGDYHTMIPASSLYQILTTYQDLASSKGIDGTTRREIDTWLKSVSESAVKVIQADMNEESWNLIALLETGKPTNIVDDFIAQHVDEIRAASKPAEFNSAAIFASMDHPPRPPSKTYDCTVPRVNVQGNERPAEDNDGNIITEERNYTPLLRLTDGQIKPIRVKLPGSLSSYLFGQMPQVDTDGNGKKERYRFDIAGGSAMKKEGEGLGAAAGDVELREEVSASTKARFGTLLGVRVADTLQGTSFARLMEKLMPNKEAFYYFQRILMPSAPDNVTIPEGNVGHVLEGNFPLKLMIDRPGGPDHPFKLKNGIQLIPQDGHGFIKASEARKMPAVEQAGPRQRYGKWPKANLPPQALQHYAVGGGQGYVENKAKLKTVAEEFYNNGNAIQTRNRVGLYSNQDVFRRMTTGRVQGHIAIAVPSGDSKVHVPSTKQVKDEFGGLLVGKSPYDKANIRPIDINHVARAGQDRDATAEFLSESTTIQYSFIAQDNNNPDQANDDKPMFFSKGLLTVIPDELWPDNMQDRSVIMSAEDVKTHSDWVDKKDRVKEDTNIDTRGILVATEVFGPGSCVAMPPEEQKKLDGDFDGDPLLLLPQSKFLNFYKLVHEIDQGIQAQKQALGLQTLKPEKSHTPAIVKNEDGTVTYEFGRAEQIMPTRLGVLELYSTLYSAFAAKPTEEQETLAKQIAISTFEGIPYFVKSELSTGSTGEEILQTVANAMPFMVKDTLGYQALEWLAQCIENNDTENPELPETLKEKLPGLDEALRQRQGTDAKSLAVAVENSCPAEKMSYREHGFHALLNDPAELVKRLLSLGIKTGTDAFKSNTGARTMANIAKPIQSALAKNEGLSVPYNKGTARLLGKRAFDPVKIRQQLENNPTLAGMTMLNAMELLIGAGLLDEYMENIEEETEDRDTGPDIADIHQTRFIDSEQDDNEPGID